MHSSSRIFRHHKQKSCFCQAVTHHFCSATPPAPWQSQICFLYLWIYLFWTFPLNGCTQHVAFCVWLLFRSVVVPRLTHVVACVFHFLWPNNIPLCKYATFCLSVHPLMDLWIVLPFSSCVYCSHKYSCRHFCWNTCFQVLLGTHLGVKLLGHMGLHKDGDNVGRHPSFRVSQVVLVVKNPPANAGDTRDVGSIPPEWVPRSGPLGDLSWRVTHGHHSRRSSRTRELTLE